MYCFRTELTVACRSRMLILLPISLQVSLPTFSKLPPTSRMPNPADLHFTGIYSHACSSCLGDTACRQAKNHLWSMSRKRRVAGCRTAWPAYSEVPLLVSTPTAQRMLLDPTCMLSCRSWCWRCFSPRFWRNAASCRQINTDQSNNKCDNASKLETRRTLMIHPLLCLQVPKH
jgi:hypothetical protein